MTQCWNTVTNRSVKTWNDEYLQNVSLVPQKNSAAHAELVEGHLLKVWKHDLTVFCLNMEIHFSWKLLQPSSVSYHGGRSFERNSHLHMQITYPRTRVCESRSFSPPTDYFEICPPTENLAHEQLFARTASLAAPDNWTSSRPNYPLRSISG